MDTYILFKQNYETSNTYEQINNHIGINLTLLLYDDFFSLNKYYPTSYMY